MKKKLINKAAVISMIALSLAGCSKSGTEVNKVNEDGVKKELVISVESESNFLSQAARKYMEANQDVTITINIVDTQNDRDKYTQVVNTEIMGGKGSDIYDALFLSYFQLADNNLLVDLNEYIGEELDHGNYYRPLMDSLIYKEKRYAVPLSFSFTGYKFNQDVADEYSIKVPNGNLTFNDLLELSSQLPKDGSVLLFEGSTDVSLADDLVVQRFDEFVDMAGKAANIDQESFYSIVNGVKLMADNQQIYTKKAMENNEIDFSIPRKSLITEYALYTPAMCNSGTMDYKGMIHLTNDQGNTTFTTSTFIPVINNNSKNKELAADFILFLLSDEMQTSPEILFCPVNKNAVSEVSRMTYEDSKAGGWLPEDFTEETLEQNIEKFEELIESLSIYYRQDRTIKNFIFEELDLFFQGSESLEQAAGNLQSSINSYLKE